MEELNGKEYLPESWTSWKIDGESDLGNIFTNLQILRDMYSGVYVTQKETNFSVKIITFGVGYHDDVLQYFVEFNIIDGGMLYYIIPYFLPCHEFFDGVILNRTKETGR